MASDVEWDPTGRYVTTSVSWWGHKVILFCIPVAFYKEARYCLVLYIKHLIERLDSCSQKSSLLSLHF